MRRSTITALVLTSVAGATLGGLPAAAAPPTTRVVQDAHEPRSAYDIETVTLTSAPAGHKRATVVVEHDRRVRVGDGISVWINTDDDPAPDLFVTGYAFSEYTVHRSRSWTRHGKDISDRGCASLRMRGERAIVRFDPDCLEPATKFSVSVRSFVQGRPDRTADDAPRARQFTHAVLAHSTV
ncbi:hypothetical protein ABLE68_03650 [Nocardioides sp. CN2-186]|uniref:hypothetical protein n=1 Tax=Nocardioides tweenelious TaxID=3156607 RepID=UPI0032B381F5